MTAPHEALVEVICQRGCRYTRAAIALLASGGRPEELRAVSGPVADAVRRELEDLMAVYGDACPVTAPAAPAS